ncbi:MAG: hypothetical protein ACI8W0_000867 [Flavobacterium sp.]
MIGIPRVLSYFNDGKKTAVEIQQPLNRIIQLTAIAAPEIKKIKKTNSNKNRCGKTFRDYADKAACQPYHCTSSTCSP